MITLVLLLIVGSLISLLLKTAMKSHEYRVTALWSDVRYLAVELWRGFREENYVLFSQPHILKGWSRCVGCGRVFMHYWGVVRGVDRERGRRVGCKCGSMRMREDRNMPTWQQAWFLLSRYVWRKIVKNETYWDPRLVYREHADVQ